MALPMMNLNETILHALHEDPRTKGANIDVAASMQGIVTLTGKVKSESVRAAAEEIARSQEGVISVVDEIKVG
jgi:osmotically-inducible protein OsmY